MNGERPNSSSHFYGERVRRFSPMVTRIERRVARMRERPVSSLERPSLFGDTQTWRTFSRQCEALKFVAEKGLGLMTFAVEGEAIGDGGRRQFLACHPRVFWKVMKERPLPMRCAYEVIPEGHPCKLYFDLEFSRSLNPHVDGFSLTSTFITVVNHYLGKEFGLDCSPENVLNLDSTTDTKFSRHLIYNIPKVAFADNSHVGWFVKMVCDNLREAVEGVARCHYIPSSVTQNDVENLFVRTDSSPKSLFCDEGVYTRNRNFRTYASTKFGKRAPLLLSSQNEYLPSVQHGEEQYFLDSLITLVPENAEILRCRQELREPSVMDEEMECCWPSTEGNLSSRTAASSPYVEIEDFLQRYLGGEDLLRSWKYFRESELLLFQIDKRHRFCHNIGRDHKSNCVMYVVNLRKGVFYQKCHDPDCRGFKSNEVPLPAHTMPWKLLTDEFSEGPTPSEREKSSKGGRCAGEWTTTTSPALNELRERPNEGKFIEFDENSVSSGWELKRQPTQRRFIELDANSVSNGWELKEQPTQGRFIELGANSVSSGWELRERLNEGRFIEFDEYSVSSGWEEPKGEGYGIEPDAFDTRDEVLLMEAAKEAEEEEKRRLERDRKSPPLKWYCAEELDNGGPHSTCVIPSQNGTEKDAHSPWKLLSRKKDGKSPQEPHRTEEVNDGDLHSMCVIPPQNEDKEETRSQQSLPSPWNRLSQLDWQDDFSPRVAGELEKEESPTELKEEEEWEVFLSDRDLTRVLDDFESAANKGS